jgi:prepilin-type N-terminal cleavage/methylation domain-containing protein
VTAGISRGSSGFTIVETLIVIAIVAILALVSVPFFSGFIDNRNLKTAARDISGAVYEAKEKAMAETTAYRISFGTGADSYYEIHKCANAGLPCGSYSSISKNGLSGIGRGLKINSAAAFDIQPRGTLSQISNITLENSRGSTATVAISILGRTNVTWTLK